MTKKKNTTNDYSTIRIEHRIFFRRAAERVGRHLWTDALMNRTPWAFLFLFLLTALFVQSARAAEYCALRFRDFQTTDVSWRSCADLTQPVVAPWSGSLEQNMISCNSLLTQCEYDAPAVPDSAHPANIALNTDLQEVQSSGVGYTHTTTQICSSGVCYRVSVQLSTDYYYPSDFQNSGKPNNAISSASSGGVTTYISSSSYLVPALGFQSTRGDTESEYIAVLTSAMSNFSASASWKDKVQVVGLVPFSSSLGYTHDVKYRAIADIHYEYPAGNPLTIPAGAEWSAHFALNSAASVSFFYAQSGYERLPYAVTVTENCTSEQIYDVATDSCFDSQTPVSGEKPGAILDRGCAVFLPELNIPLTADPDCAALFSQSLVTTPAPGVIDFAPSFDAAGNEILTRVSATSSGSTVTTTTRNPATRLEKTDVVSISAAGAVQSYSSGSQKSYNPGASSLSGSSSPPSTTYDPAAGGESGGESGGDSDGDTGGETAPVSKLDNGTFAPEISSRLKEFSDHSFPVSDACPADIFSFTLPIPAVFGGDVVLSDQGKFCEMMDSYGPLLRKLAIAFATICAVFIVMRL